MRLKQSLPLFEVRIYYSLWIGLISYSIYLLYFIGNEYLGPKFKDEYNDFTFGWKWLNRKRDNADREWINFQILLIALIPWIIIHSLGAELLRQLNFRKELLYIWYSVISLMFMINQFGPKSVLYFLFQPLSGYFLTKFKSKLLLWIYFISVIFAVNYHYKLGITLSELTYSQRHTVVVAIMWTNIRCLIYTLDIVSSAEKSKTESNLKSIITLLGYCLYLPLMYFGPIILYRHFKTMFSNENKPFWERLKVLVVRFIRFGFWMFFAEIVLHFIYINSLSFQSKILNEVSMWALYGLGYCMGQFFHVKYVVYYGMSTTLAQFENIPIPKTPICIGRVHLYSNMWKYFDYGLYLFLLHYIYIPLCRGRRTVPVKILASTVSFIFINVWHGLHNFVAIWSLLNFIGVTIETLSGLIADTDLYRNFVQKTFTPQWHQRFVCLLSAPLYVMSAISNFYFFAGRTTGNVYVRRTLAASPLSKVCIIMVSYFGCQVSTHVKQWETSKQKAKLK